MAITGDFSFPRCPCGAGTVCNCALPQRFYQPFPSFIPVSPLPQPAVQGWQCPRCQRVNAPWVQQCSCANQSKITWQIKTTTNTTEG